MEDSIFFFALNGSNLPSTSSRVWFSFVTLSKHFYFAIFSKAFSLLQKMPRSAVGPASLPFNNFRTVFPGRKATGNVKPNNYPIYYQGKECVELYLHSLPRAFTTCTGINLYFISCVHMTTLPCILVLYVRVNQNTSHFFLIFLLRFAFTCCSMVSHITSVPRAVFTTFSDRLRDATRVTYGTPTALTLTYPEAIPLVFPRVVRYNCSIPAPTHVHN